MADLSGLDRESLERKWTGKLAEKWVADGERLHWLVAPEQGYVGSTVAGRALVPHSAFSAVRPPAVDLPEWPLPGELVVSGRFLDDEWADDPSILWWVFADSPDRNAVRFADHFASVPGEAFFVSTSRRLAVVVEQGKLGTQQPQEQQGEGKSWLGRVRSAASQVQQTAEGLAAIKDAKLPVSYYEVSNEQVASVKAVPLGRGVPREPFLRIDFADGSVLLARDVDAASHAAEFSGPS